MDLREVVAKVKTAAEGAHSSFHAGRLDGAEKYLGEIRLNLEAYFDVPASPASDVTESATTEKDVEVPQEKPAEVPGAQEWPGAVHSEHAVPPVEQLPQFEKPSQ